MGYRQAQERNKRLKKMEKVTRNSRTGGAYFDERKGRYVRLYRPNRWLKSYSRRLGRNRFNREEREKLSKGNSYRKLFDYWWTLD